eukprot:13487147-Alexandrium_andersonii.AAC.1
MPAPHRASDSSRSSSPPSSCSFAGRLSRRICSTCVWCRTAPGTEAPRRMPPSDCARQPRSSGEGAG